MDSNKLINKEQNIQTQINIKKTDEAVLQHNNLQQDKMQEANEISSVKVKDLNAEIQKSYQSIDINAGFVEKIASEPSFKELSIIDKRYSEKDRRKMKDASSELYKKAEKLKQELDKKKKTGKIKSSEEHDLNLKILNYESEAKKKLIMAHSKDAETEEFNLNMEDMRRLAEEKRINSRIYGDSEFFLEYLDKDVDVRKQEVLHKLRGNNHFVEYRKNTISQALDAYRNSDKISELIEDPMKVLGEQFRDMYTEEDVFAEIEDLLNNEESIVIDEMMEDIKKYCDELGGKPNYPDEEPRMEKRAVRIGNHSIENRRAWADKLIDRGNIFEKAYGKIIKNQAGSIDYTTYEKSCRFMHTMQLLAKYKPVLKKVFTEDSEKQDAEIKRLPLKDQNNEEKCKAIYAKYGKCKDVMLTLTRLSCHNELNGAASEMKGIDEALSIITRQYRHIKASNDQKLMKEFFIALDGACFDDRLKVLQDFASKHPIDEDSRKCKPPVEKESLYILTRDFESRLVIDEEKGSPNDAATQILNMIIESNKLDLNVTNLYWGQVVEEITRRLYGMNLKGSPVNEDTLKGIKNFLTNDAWLITETPKENLQREKEIQANSINRAEMLLRKKNPNYKGSSKKQPKKINSVKRRTQNKIIPEGYYDLKTAAEQPRLNRNMTVEEIFNIYAKAVRKAMGIPSDEQLEFQKIIPLIDDNIGDVPMEYPYPEEYMPLHEPLKFSSDFMNSDYCKTIARDKCGFIV